MNTCLIISTVLLTMFLLGMIVTLKIQNAVQAERLQWQARQIQTLQEQQGFGCGGTLLLIMIAILLLGTLLLTVAAGAAGLP